MLLSKAPYGEELVSRALDSKSLRSARQYELRRRVRRLVKCPPDDSFLDSFAQVYRRICRPDRLAFGARSGCSYAESTNDRIKRSRRFVPFHSRLLRRDRIERTQKANVRSRSFDSLPVYRAKGTVGDGAVSPG